MNQLTNDIPTTQFALFTDYGLSGPYVGLLHAVISGALPQARIIDLQHDLPPFRPRGAGILLAPLLRWLPATSMVVAVVDPGVGGGRRGLVVDYAGLRLVGPDNGLFAPLLAGADCIRTIEWLPEEMSATFHGRDWFAPVAARLAAGEQVPLSLTDVESCVGSGWPPVLSEIVYIDGFGNLVTGIPRRFVDNAHSFQLGEWALKYAHTFVEVAPGIPFWHVNSLGLVEFAVNQGSAADLLGLAVGDPVPMVDRMHNLP